VNQGWLAYYRVDVFLTDVCLVDEKNLKRNEWEHGVYIIYLEDVNSLQINILSSIFVGVSILWNGENQIYIQ